jgi:hypothetical protein
MCSPQVRQLHRQLSRQAVLVVDQKQAGRGRIAPFPEHEIKVVPGRTAGEAPHRQGLIATGDQSAGKSLRSCFPGRLHLVAQTALASVSSSIPSVLQEHWMQKFRDILNRWDGEELSMLEASELLGMSERSLVAIATATRRKALRSLPTAGWARCRLAVATQARWPSGLNPGTALQGRLSRPSGRAIDLRACRKFGIFLPKGGSDG